MRMVRDLSLMTIGAGMVLLYQKYNKPMMEALKEKIACTCDDIEDML